MLRSLTGKLRMENMPKCPCNGTARTYFTRRKATHETAFLPSLCSVRIRNSGLFDKAFGPTSRTVRHRHSEPPRYEEVPFLTELKNKFVERLIKSFDADFTREKFLYGAAQVSRRKTCKLDMLSCVFTARGCMGRLVESGHYN